MAQTIILYDVAMKGDTNEERMWSPNTWKARLALNIKGLAHKTEWVLFTDLPETLKKLGLPPNENSFLKYSVPTIYDPSTKRAVMGSQNVLTYLDDQYPDTVKLLPKETRATQAAFCEQNYNLYVGAVFSLILSKHLDRVQDKDKDYFRQSRPGMLGKKSYDEIEPTGEARKETLKLIENWLGDLNRWIAENGEGATFIGGTTPSSCDAFVAGMLLWGVRLGGKGHDLTELISNANDGKWAKYLESFSKWTTLH